VYTNTRHQSKVVTHVKRTGEESVVAVSARLFASSTVYSAARQSEQFPWPKIQEDSGKKEWSVEKGQEKHKEKGGFAY